MNREARSPKDAPATQTRKSYRKPTLTAYGSLASLTAAGPGGSPEMAAMAMETRRL
jgi:hypothetical protein